MQLTQSPNQQSKWSQNPARILVVDDHPMVRAGLLDLLGQQRDMVCCGEASTGGEAMEAAARLSPDLVILDLRLKGEDGLEIIKSLRSRAPGVLVLILSQHEGPLYVERSLRAGARGYVVKEQAAEEVLSAIRAVLAGEVYLSRGMAALFLHRFVAATPDPSQGGLRLLTDRELHVLQLLGAGLSTREAATQLNLSFKTVETHRENIKQKLGIRDAPGLVHFATKWARESISVPTTDLALEASAT